MALTKINNKSISGALTTTQIPDLDTAKITTGTLADARIPNLDTAKITTGTMAAARISEDSVTQHVTETDLQPVKSDLTALAIREATNESSAAFNLPNSFIDTFSDETNLGTKTTVALSSGAIITNVGAGYALTDDAQTESLIHSNTTNGSTTFTQSAAAADGSFSIGGTNGADADDGLRHDTAQKKFGSSSMYFPGGDNLAFINHPGWGTWDIGTADFTFECWIKTDGTQSGLVGIIGDEAASTRGGNANKGMGNLHIDTSGYLKMMGGQLGTLTSSASVVDGNWHHVAFSRTSGTGYLFKDGTQVATGTMSGNCSNHCPVYVGTTDQGWYGDSDPPQSFKGWMDEIRISIAVGRYTASFTPATEATTFSATGTLIQSANAVGSAKTKVGGTMLYKDNAGTATLGTDLKIYFSCGGGSNWTEATSYSAITPVYSTGIKQVRLGETTCTSGTDVRYKAVWANQASGSKETQLHGIGVNY